MEAVTTNYEQIDAATRHIPDPSVYTRLHNSGVKSNYVNVSHNYSETRRESHVLVADCRTVHTW